MFRGNKGKSAESVTTTAMVIWLPLKSVHPQLFQPLELNVSHVKEPFSRTSFIVSSTPAWLMVNALYELLRAPKHLGLVLSWNHFSENINVMLTIVACNCCNYNRTSANRRIFACAYNDFPLGDVKYN